MIESILYILLALLGISFLIFIHELGHYFMARRVGITVEVFAIGFGKSIVEWERKGVKWKIGCLPFGGYVKMAGMEKKGPLEPYQIEGGFFASKPWDRIKVAAIGPIVNILFALLAFSALYFLGGREKPFSEFTHTIGYVEQDSNLYASNIRPGDRIEKLNGRSFKNFQDLVYGAVLDKQQLAMSGLEVNYWTGQKIPFTYTFTGEQSEDGMERALSVTQALSPAQYLLYQTPKGNVFKMPQGSPLEGSGIRHGDRILWVDGQLVFSVKQLIRLVNSDRVLLSIDRNGSLIQTRVPRLQIADLRLSQDEQAEFDDWRDEAGLDKKVKELFFIPYNINSDNIVESPLAYIDEEARAKEHFSPHDRVASETPLLPGDRILAVQGINISDAYELLREMQTPKTLMIVKKGNGGKPISWKEADQGFIDSFAIADLKKIVNSIGTSKVIPAVGELSLLKPIVPVPIEDLPQTDQQRSLYEEKVSKYKESIEAIANKEEKQAALKRLETYQNRLMLGLAVGDKVVRYNPNPFTLFGDVLKETYRTFFALITGYLSPKYISGPVGIVQVIQHGWSQGAKEALFWLGMISMNLGILNLLPIPVLDGGHICFSLWEMITKKPLKAKTMERLILPFVILIVVFFIYLTYNDIVRIISQFF